MFIKRQSPWGSRIFPGGLAHELRAYEPIPRGDLSLSCVSVNPSCLLMRVGMGLAYARVVPSIFINDSAYLGRLVACCRFMRAQLVGLST